MTIEDYQKIFHEIKNNITFINSSLQLVEKQHPEINTFSYWNDTIQEVKALKNMLTDLSSARLCDDLSLQKSNSALIFPDLIHSCMTLFDSENFHCEITLASSLPEIRLDTNRFKRALFNLIKNSYEAMSGSGSIQFQIRKEDSFLRIDLTDCGGGIPKEFLPKLFIPFETTKQDGTGLGLLIAKQIIEAHGGHLTVDSVPQKGCTFSIYLPVA